MSQWKFLTVVLDYKRWVVKHNKDKVGFGQLEKILWHKKPKAEGEGSPFIIARLGENCKMASTRHSQTWRFEVKQENNARKCSLTNTHTLTVAPHTGELKHCLAHVTFTLQNCPAHLASDLYYSQTPPQCSF